MTTHTCPQYIVNHIMSKKYMHQLRKSERTDNLWMFCLFPLTLSIIICRRLGQRDPGIHVWTGRYNLNHWFRSIWPHLDCGARLWRLIAGWMRTGTYFMLLQNRAVRNSNWSMICNISPVKWGVSGRWVWDGAANKHRHTGHGSISSIHSTDLYSKHLWVTAFSEYLYTTYIHTVLGWLVYFCIMYWQMYSIINDWLIFAKQYNFTQFIFT